ncbi:MAG: ABC transporter permease [Gammaproteobacteria bacterium]|jgi:peptide/nickel transport system permease protein
MKSVYSLPLFILLVWTGLAVLAPILPLYPDQIFLDKILLLPCWEQWLGYDDLGRSISARLIMGARTSLTVAIIVVSISFLLGTFLGVLGAWLGGFWDKCLIMVVDLFIAFPGVLLAIALAGLLGPGLMNAVIALSIVSWVGFARLARVQTLAIQNREHINAAHALGTTDLIISIKHILPLIMAPLVVEATFAFAGVVIAEAGLSFLGLGVQPPAASWGSMIRDGTRYMLIAPHMVLAPGFAILSLVLSINLLGDTLRDKMDIKEISKT